MVYCTRTLTKLLVTTYIYSLKAVDRIFYGFPAVINPLHMLGEHKKIL